MMFEHHAIELLALGTLGGIVPGLSRELARRGADDGLPSSHER
ncbi:hypothetical protein ACFSKM_01555 [Ancylobacter dichloromethanicus]